MAGRIPNEVVEEVRARTDIVELISEYLPLQKRGKNYFALCPFHLEKTPSFCVNPERQVYHCFGCGVGGNVFTFLMEYEKLSFLEVVQTLARRAGVALPRVGDESRKPEEYDALYRANRFAANYYHWILQKRVGQKARDYLKARGLGEEVIKRFWLGYAPPGWDNLLRAAGGKSIPPEVLLRAGLILSREGGGSYYDRFRDRIVFPIFTPGGRVVGFGGRVSEDVSGQPKYINSPETPIYSKGKTLYGLPQSRDAIRNSKKAILVEGYTDLLSLFQAGFENVVATLGTALTLDQARLLARYADEALLVYDADPAGVKAALRGAGVLLEAGLDVKVAPLPLGTDPDNFVRREGKERFLNLLDGALSFVDFALQAIRQEVDLSTVEGMSKAINVVAELLGRVKDGVKRRLWVRRVADTLSVEEGVILHSLSRFRGRKGYGGEWWPETSVPRREVDPAELELLRLMLGDRETVKVVRNHLDPKDLEDGVVKEVVEVLFELVDEGGTMEPATLINMVNGAAAKRLIPQLALDQGHPDKREKLLSDCILSIQRKGIARKLKRIQEELRLAQKRKDEATIVRLAEEYKCLIETREELKNRVMLTP